MSTVKSDRATAPAPAPAAGVTDPSWALRLRRALAFRNAMENSLVTGLRARALDGRTTYVNPSFCRMVGFDAAELIDAETPPYWPPERAAEYLRRNTPLPKEGTADDIVGAVLWLVGDAGSYVTGQTVVVDGGWTAR